MTQLRARERRVLDLLAEGRTYDEIARIFNVSEDRVRQVETAARAARRRDPDPDDYEVRMAIIRGELVPKAEVERLRDALWAIVQETSNDPQRIKDAAREALAPSVTPEYAAAARA